MLDHIKNCEQKCEQEINEAAKVKHDTNINQESVVPVDVIDSVSQEVDV